MYTVDSDIDDDLSTIKTAIGAYRVTSITHNGQTGFWAVTCDSEPQDVSDYVLIGDGWTGANELHGELCRVHSLVSNTIYCWPTIYRSYDLSRTLAMTGVFPKVSISACTLYTPPTTTGTAAVVFTYFCPRVSITDCAFANAIQPHPTYAHGLPYLAPVSCRNVTIEQCRGMDIAVNTSIDVQLIDCDVKGVGFEEECANVMLDGIRGIYNNRSGPKRGVNIRSDTENVMLLNCNIKQCEQFLLPPHVSVSGCSLGIANRGRFYLDSGSVTHSSIIGDLFARGPNNEIDSVAILSQLKLEQGSSGTIRRHRAASFIDASGEWSADSAR